MQKNGCANLLDFLDNRQTSGRRRADVGQRRADVGQTSGRRRARRARNVGQTSGTSGEPKVVETEKKSPPWNRGGKIEKEEPVL